MGNAPAILLFIMLDAITLLPQHAISQPPPTSADPPIPTHMTLPASQVGHPIFSPLSPPNQAGGHHLTPLP